MIEHERAVLAPSVVTTGPGTAFVGMPSVAGQVAVQVEPGYHPHHEPSPYIAGDALLVGFACAGVCVVVRVTGSEAWQLFRGP